MKSIILQSAIAGITEEHFHHPGLRLVKFVFCDDKPNENGQGIEYEDFKDIMASSVGTPVKMKFLGESAGGHLGSIPIGYIQSMSENRLEDGTNQLLAVATLFANEYPDEVEFLLDRWDRKQKGEAVDVPGISWELSYSESVVKEGIEWLKGLLTRAATFVRSPAYGNRTAILALASNRSISDERFLQAISELTNEASSTTNEGGTDRMDEKELARLQAEVERLTAELEAKSAEASSKVTEVEELTTKVTDLETSVAEKDTIISEYKTRELIEARTSALVEAGIKLPEDADKLAKKQEFYASMSEEAFAEYKEDLISALAETKKTSSKDALAERLNPVRVPRFSGEAAKPSISDLATRLGSLSRTAPTSE